MREPSTSPPASLRCSTIVAAASYIGICFRLESRLLTLAFWTPFEPPAYPDHVARACNHWYYFSPISIVPCHKKSHRVDRHCHLTPRWRRGVGADHGTGPSFGPPPCHIDRTRRTTPGVGVCVPPYLDFEWLPCRSALFRAENGTGTPVRRQDRTKITPSRVLKRGSPTPTPSRAPQQDGRQICDSFPVWLHDAN